MSLREKLNQNTVWVAAAAVLGLLVCIYVVYQQWTADRPGANYVAYFTIDDGKSFFAGDINQTVPFQKSGKEAVKAHVFEKDGKKVVVYLSKMTDQAKAAVEKYEADCASKPQERPASWYAAQTAYFEGWVFKKPGEGTWTRKKSDLKLDIRGSDGQPLAELTQ